MADTKFSEMSGTKVLIGLGITIVVSIIVFVSIKQAWDKRLEEGDGN